jgi:DNA-binding transcriptional regulator GbsR (MarR family)
MTDQEAAFVEEFSGYLASLGMTPMSGRMWGWLLICEPAEQTAAELAEALQASRGAISGTARTLEAAGFIRRTRRRGDRREYFSAPPSTFRSFIQGAGAMYRRLREIMEHGLAVVADRPPLARERIREAHEFITYVEGQFPALLEGFLKQQAHLAAAEEGLSA